MIFRFKWLVILTHPKELQLKFCLVGFLLKPVKYQKALTVLFVWLLLKVSADQGVRTVTSLAVPFYDCPQTRLRW